MQQSFLEKGAVQCGFCTPGMVLTVTALLKETPKPSDQEIKKALEGNICRCTGYNKIVQAIDAAAGRRDSRRNLNSCWGKLFAISFPQRPLQKFLMVAEYARSMSTAVPHTRENTIHRSLLPGGVQVHWAWRPTMHLMPLAFINVSACAKELLAVRGGPFCKKALPGSSSQITVT